MTKVLVYICLIIDGGLFFLIPGLKGIYGIKDGDISPPAFDAWKYHLTPARDIYFMTAFAVSLGLLLALAYSTVREKRRLDLIEVIGACVAVTTIVLLIIVSTSIPRGGMLG